MPRLSIDITPEQHQRLKAFAALRGQSIKEYVLERSLPLLPDETETDAETLKKLEALLKPRIEAVERGEISKKSFGQIKQKARTYIES